MPLRSMTGFGQAQRQSGTATVKVEIRTVNHRFAEFSVRLPRDLLALEDSVRACLSDRIPRGRVDAYVSVEQTQLRAHQVDVDWALFDALLDAERSALVRAGARLNTSEAVSDTSASVVEWLHYEDVLKVSNEAFDVESLRQDVVLAAGVACDALLDMRAREGARIAEDLLRKTDDLKRIVEGVALLAPQTTIAQRERLQQRLATLGVAPDEQRWLTEVALIAERSAIDEELVRLDSHAAEFRQSLEVGSPVGRRLDFVIQEMQREWNTIASKASDLQISKAVIDAKSVVEQLREQVQNIE